MHMAELYMLQEIVGKTMNHYLLGLTHIEKGKWTEKFSNQRQNISHKKLTFY